MGWRSAQKSMYTHGHLPPQDEIRRIWMRWILRAGLIGLALLLVVGLALS